MNYRFLIIVAALVTALGSAGCSTDFWTGAAAGAAGGYIANETLDDDD